MIRLVCLTCPFEASGADTVWLAAYACGHQRSTGHRLRLKQITKAPAFPSDAQYRPGAFILLEETA